MRSVVLGLTLVALVACGEPEPDLVIPERDPGQHILDQAGVLDTSQLHDRLSQVNQRDDYDIVALTFETEQANCGEAFRAGALFVERWDADIAIVAVAKPGDFTSEQETRVRCVGVQPAGNPVPAEGVLRERIAEEVVPPFAAENDWTGAFSAAVDEMLSQ